MPDVSDVASERREIRYVLDFKIKTSRRQVPDDETAQRLGRRISGNLYDRLKELVGDEIIYLGPPTADYRKGSLVGAVAFVILAVVPNVLPLLARLQNDARMEVELRPAFDDVVGPGTNIARFSSRGAVSGPYGLEQTWDARLGSPWRRVTRIGQASGTDQVMRGTVTPATESRLYLPLYLLFVAVCLIAALALVVDERLEADRDRRELRCQLELIWNRAGEEARVEINSHAVLFAYGSSRLDDVAARSLITFTDQVGRDAVFRIDGFADSSGSYAANVRLSNARAEAVADQLRSRGLRVESIGVGLGRTDQFGAENRQNRRVVVTYRLPVSPQRADGEFEQCQRPR